MEAATAVSRQGVRVHPHIMVPLVSIKEELTDQVAVIRETAARVAKETGVKIDYKVGCCVM